MARTDDPKVIERLVVTAGDVVSALEAQRRDRRVVLRLTPPFSERMRARLRVVTEAGFERTPASLSSDEPFRQFRVTRTTKPD